MIEGDWRAAVDGDFDIAAAGVTGEEQNDTWRPEKVKEAEAEVSLLYCVLPPEVRASFQVVQLPV